MNRRNFLSSMTLAAIGSNVTYGFDPNPSKEKSLIFVWLGGGISDIDFINPLPNAPVEIRSNRGAVATKNGEHLGGDMQRLAAQSDKWTVVRNFHHRDANHQSATSWTMTGEVNFNNKSNNFPSHGSLVSHNKGFAKNGIPTYIQLSKIEGDGPAWLGAGHMGYRVDLQGATNLTPSFQRGKLDRRLKMVDVIEKTKPSLPQEWVDLRSKAVEMIYGNTSKALDLSGVNPSVLQQYKANTPVGKDFLLAQRLVQAGASYVNVSIGGWDMHNNISDGFERKGAELDHFSVITLDKNQELNDKCLWVSMPKNYYYLLKEGFNYQDLTSEVLSKFGVNKHPNWKIESENSFWNREVTDGEIGCSLSHVDLWVNSYEKEKEITMVLEEDFVEQLPVPWDQVESLLDKGYDLIYLGRNALKPEEENLIEGYQNWVEPSYSYNTHAYLLSKRGIELLVEHYIERYKNKMFVIDEFFSVAFKQTDRNDILTEYEDLPPLKAAAPIYNFFEQQNSKGLTNYNREELPEIRYEMPEIMNASNWQDWCIKYINPHILKGQYRLLVDEVGYNILEFPLFTDKFCDEIIQLAESQSWVTDRHEFYPTVDQTMEELGMKDIYQKVLETFVYPIFIWYWELEGDNWEKLRSENFIAKYDTDNQGSLDLHHDISLITLNVRLNDDFTGGGTYLPKYNLTINPKKKGNAMAHPGMITHKHGGRPVDSGTRYILVTFTQNP